MATYAVYNPAEVPEPFGLYNTGVICWCNSLLQVLLSCSSLNETLLKNANALVDNPLATEYIQILRATTKTPGPINHAALALSGQNILKAFIHAIRLRGQSVGQWTSQECVNEAFTMFIDIFNCEPVSKLFTNIYELSITCDGCGKTVSTIRDKSYSVHMFHGFKLKTEKQFCTWIRAHISENDHFACTCGKVMSKYNRIEKLKMLSEIVVIVFNKFYVKSNIWFPDQLHFDTKNNTVLTYRLVGQIEHGGNMQGGHYHARALRGDSFKCFNDASVSEQPAGSTPETYMIVYHLVADQ